MKLEPFHKAQYIKDEQKIVIEAPKHCDLICDCVSKTITNNAPMLLTDIAGDFTIRAKLSHSFQSLYDAACLLLYEHEQLWAKACFECAEQGVHTAVSVVTNGYSDDCSSIHTEANAIWLRINRKKDIISMQSSFDGVKWEFMRIVSLPFADQIKVGFLAQSPLGNGGTFIFEDYEITPSVFHDIRTGE